MDDIRRWLEAHGLGKYVDVFVTNEIEVDDLVYLREEDLEKLGLPMGPRKRLLGVVGASDAPRQATQGNSKHQVGANAAPKTGSAEAERRQLTVMFADLVGSTELAAALDPEDLREVNRAYQDAATAAIQAYGGYVARYMGDGVLAYFGYPQAHEDDAERAVLASLKLIEDASALEAGVELAVRVGIATGEVVVGDLIGEGAAQESAVVGETPNLAARLQSTSAPNSTVISERTHRLVAGFFDCEPLGLRSFRGFGTPVASWRVVADRPAESRFTALHPRRLTPLVGRDAELRLLLEGWERAKNGEGQAIVLGAEAGLGKSRLGEELRRQLSGETHRLIRFQCSPHHTQSAFYPFVSTLERDARMEREDSPEKRLSKLQALLGDERAAALPLFASLLGLSPPDSTLDLSQPHTHQRLLEGIAAQIVRVSRAAPVLLIFEDAHWSDPSSVEALSVIVDELRGARVLAIVTHRPEFKAPWADRSHVATLGLMRLADRQVEQMIAALAPSSVPRHVLNAIASHTDGIPLFVEELTQSVLESSYGNDAPGWPPEAGSHGRVFEIPATLQDSLIARLDRLGSAKEVAQLGAIIGRTFSEALLAAVLPLQGIDLDKALKRIVDSGLAFRRRTLDGPVFEFKHALVQDAAAATLLRERRRTLHADVARALEEVFPETAQAQPELLAHHFAAAGLTERSLGYWQIAAERARRRFANQEASEHYAIALRLLEALPRDDESRRREAALQTGLGMTLTAIKGQIAPEVGAAFRRARVLCEQLGDVEQHFVVLRGLWLHCQVGSQLQEAGEIAEELLAIATAQSRSDYAVEAHRALGQNALWRGRYRRARESFEHVLELYDAEAHGQNLHRFGQDPRALSSTMLATSLWLLGFPDAASRHLDDGLSFAAAMRHPYSRCVTGIMAMFTFALLRDWPRSGVESERTVAIATENGLPFFRALATAYAGLSEVMQGNAERGLTRLEDGIAMYQGSKEAWWYYASATALVEVGRYEAAEEALEEAFALMKASGDALVGAGFHVLEAQLLARGKGRIAEAAEALERALEISRAEQARSWELRAACALARLRCDDGDREAARDVLAPVYEWFTEGFNTADLTEARALVEQLS